MKKVQYIFFFVSFFATAHLNAQTLDPSFDAKLVGSSQRVQVHAIALQPDGKILIGSTPVRYGTQSCIIVRHDNLTGSRDNTFVPVPVGIDDQVYAIALQPDGKILIGGAFANYNGTGRNDIARLNSNGSVDAAFFGTIGGYIAMTIALQTDGKILVGGWGPDNSGYLLRLNSNGSTDVTFKAGTTSNGYVKAIDVQSDGKILIGGGFTEYNNTSANRIARLNSDGTLDTIFMSGTGIDWGGILAFQKDEKGKIFIGGNFNNYNGRIIHDIARLHSDGSLDTSFTPATETEDFTLQGIFTIALQPDGKIIIGGRFTGYNGTKRKNIARLNSDGSFDIFFDPGTGADVDVYTSALQSDGKILIGGMFGSYNDETRIGIARLLNVGSSEVADKSADKPTLAALYPVPTHGNIFITTGEQTAEHIDVTTILGQIIASIKPSSPETEISLAGKPKGMYFVTVTSRGIRQSFKLVKAE